VTSKQSARRSNLWAGDQLSLRSCVHGGGKRFILGPLLPNEAAVDLVASAATLGGDYARSGFGRIVRYAIRYADVHHLNRMRPIGRSNVRGGYEMRTSRERPKIGHLWN
jgi:hypothetical protein